MGDSQAPERSYDSVTTTHEEIRRWVRQRGGRPVSEKSTGSERRLAFRFPGDDATDGRQLEWSEFFDRFDGRDLAFAYTTEDDSETTAAACALVDTEGDEEIETGTTPPERERRDAVERVDERRVEHEVEHVSEPRERTARDQENEDNHRDEPPFYS